MVPGAPTGRAAPDARPVPATRPVRGPARLRPSYERLHGRGRRDGVHGGVSAPPLPQEPPAEEEAGPRARAHAGARGGVHDAGTPLQNATTAADRRRPEHTASTATRTASVRAVRDARLTANHPRPTSSARSAAGSRSGRVALRAHERVAVARVRPR